jgi:hypothetical protein
MEEEKYIQKLRNTLDGLPNHSKFKTLLGMGHDKDFIEKVYPNTIKTFEDLEFGPHRLGSGVQAILTFDNGHFASVVGGHSGLYGDGKTTFELGFDDGDGNIDVMGYLSPEEITEEMFKIQIKDPLNYG